MTAPPPSARRAAATLVGLSALLLVGLAWLLVPWDWVPGGELSPVRPEELLTREQIERAEAYSGVTRLLSWSAYAVSLGLALLLGLTRLGSRLLGRLFGRRAWWLAVGLGTFVLLLLGRLLTLPFAYLIHRRNLAYGLTHQGLGGWLQDRALSLLVSWVATAVLLLLVVGLARRSARWWFAWAGVAAALAVFLFSFLYPVLVEPLFNRFSPMPEGQLRTQILRLAEREGVHVDDVLVADASRRTTTLNAYVSGFGNTRRVVVYDNLLQDTPPREVLAVVAHELGHAAHHDVLLGTTLGAVGSLLGVGLLALALDWGRLRRLCGVEGPGDPRAVAVLLALLALGSFLSSPFQNAVSRAVEARADRAALAATRDPVAFVDLQRDLATHSLADPTPPRWSQLWFGSHPTLVQRAGLPRSLEEASR